ncbi:MULTISPECIES: helix-turn-helix transcriptional regulator [Macrococcus]|uniref:helix-turn-helix transcriptional regulator n=1 Tax=Macrococcus TaxID=69965 RepID=UPI001CC97F59|nr:helix-turn-helix transcriptional regulator [Macrococcus armenti]UBH10875.1 helix-turn-helix domain-containing protein [Macrococcus armenti]UBH15357.1 helix-turn-helix domain-containing protein [Macrococcus armenti]UBH17714.1 helix-turn-helix domain-containing protein [Macrococcus armenti]UBH19982.1 helix-turn-helix domain-containing protein [Macrococcus armenti]
MIKNKKVLKSENLIAKKKLREIRLQKEMTTTEVAKLIGLERRQYELKEKGRYPFHDYEMKILSQNFNTEIKDLFF